MDNVIYDWKAQSYLKRLIDTRFSLQEKFQVRSILHCHETVIPNGTMHVNLKVSSKRAAFVGQVSCKNPFACPCCSARVMSKYAGQIAAALDAMKAKGYKAFLFTFTIPHLRFQTCREVTDILYQTWRLAFANCFSKRKKADGKTLRASGSFNSWCSSGQLKHYIRVMEYTWGQNGWHPHFHCIFFVKHELFDECTTRLFESTLNQEWIKYFQRATVRYWQKNNLHGDDANRDAIMGRLLKFASGQFALKITRQANGNAVPFSSAKYVAGFGGEDELAGSAKQKVAHHAGHYTPHQILDKAMSGETSFDDLYLEFLLQVTRKPVHHRVNFSKTGLKAILTEWQNKEGMQEVLKKKVEEEMKVIASFDKSNWQKLALLNRRKPVLALMLKYAVTSKQMLIWYLMALNDEEGIEVNLMPELQEIYKEECQFLERLENTAG